MDFFDSFVALSFLPYIYKPTRITNVTASTLDHIFCNNPGKVFKSGIVITDISDHLTPFIILKSNNFDSEPDIEVRKIDFSEENMKHFCSELKKVKWERLNYIRGANDRYNYFFKLYKDTYDKCFPVKLVKTKNKVDKPWVTKEVIKLSKRKHILYRKYLRNSTTLREMAYKECRNVLNNLIRENTMCIL